MNGRSETTNIRKILEAWTDDEIIKGKWTQNDAKLLGVRFVRTVAGNFVEEIVVLDCSVLAGTLIFACLRASWVAIVKLKRLNREV